MRRGLSAALGGLLFVCLLVVGCGDKQAKMAQVSGTVDLDGKPLSSGEISFVGEAGTAPDVLQVENGAFSGKVKVGKKKVEVRAYKTEKAPPSATGGAMESKVNYIGKAYNENSKLTAEVSDSGVNPNKFDVKTN